MLRVICVRTGDKYDQWYEDNLKHMIDTYSGLEYDEWCVIHDDIYEMSVANKLQMFDRYRDGQNIYFDLDVLIKGDCNQFLTRELHVCHAWWRYPYHTPLNSSIMSWNGDLSHIFKTYDDNQDYYMLKYHRGIDQYLYKIYSPHVYTKGFCSFQSVITEEDYDVYLFNQRQEEMKSLQDWWFQKYFLPIESHT